MHDMTARYGNQRRQQVVGTCTAALAAGCRNRTAAAILVAAQKQCRYTSIIGHPAVSATYDGCTYEKTLALARAYAANGTKQKQRGGKKCRKRQHDIIRT